MDTPDEQIANLVQRFASPPQTQLSAFIARGRRSLTPKGSALVALGETAHALFFVHSGIVRYFLIDPESGDDVTKDFSFAPVFAVSFGSAVQRLPARVAIAAVEDCVVTRWPFAEMEALFDADPEWQKFGRKVAEWLYIRKEDRELSFLTRTAEQRYLSMLADHQERIDAIPQHILAHYLGITPESLSRLKQRIHRDQKKRTD